MEYMYAAMLLHKAGKKVDEASLNKVLEAAGIKVDKAKVTVVVNALNGVDIDKVLKEAIVAPVAAAPVASEEKSTGKEDKKEEKKEEKVDDTEAAAGLGALFG